MEAIRIGIVGGAGYTGGELLRILVNHPRVEIVFVHSKSNAGKPVSNVHTDLIGDTDIRFSDTISQDIDVLFLCVGHGDARKFLDANSIAERIKIIDLSQDFRLSHNSVHGNRNFVYGLPELNMENIDDFSEQLRRLIFTGGIIPSSNISTICGSSGMLSRPSNYNSKYSVVVPPLVLYSLALSSSKYIGRQNAAYLVPFRMSSGYKFENFIACWFALQFQLGRSPRSVFNVYDNRSAFLLCTELFNLSKETRLFEFRNRTIFFNSLPNIESTYIDLNLSTSGNISNLFGFATPSEGYRVWVIEDPSDPGFDLMISFSTPGNVIKKVLLVQCKTKVVTTSDDGGEGQSVNSKTFSDALVNCSPFVKVLESNEWEVSFLGLYSCNTTRSVIPKSCPAGVSPAFFERSAAIGNTGMFNLLGDSFGLALELAKGHKFRFHASLGKKPIQLDGPQSPKTEGL